MARTLTYPFATSLGTTLAGTMAGRARDASGPREGLSPPCTVSQS